MNIFTRRVAWAYSAILVGALLFMLRRLVLPTYFELEGVPFAIAVGSALNSCYGRPTLNNCGDGLVFVLTTIGVVVATGWGSLGRSIFAVILAVLPVGLYFAFAPLGLPVLLLLLIPLAIEAASQLLFPDRG
mgnify:CR=1 FL=1